MPDFLTANMDTSVSPRVDFFRYATGGWLKRNPIPDDQGRWGIWNVESEHLYDQLRRTSEMAAASRAPRGSAEQLIGDFWYTGMDSITINRNGLAPLRPVLDRIDAIRSIADLIDAVAILHRRNMLLDGPFGFVGPRTLFSAGVRQDERNSNRRIFSLTQGGISLGRPVYFATDSQRVMVRGAFQQYLFRTFLRLADDTVRARASARAVLDLETRLAERFYQSDDHQVLEHTALFRLAPSIDWDRYFRQIRAEGLDSVEVQRPRFFTALDTLLRTIPLETWRDYLRFCVVRSHAPFLDDGTFGEFFAFASVRTGARQPRPRWRRVVWQEKNWLGQALAQVFEGAYFPPGLKARHQALAESLRQAFRDRIVKLDWLSNDTRQHALLKLDHLKITIGLPEKRVDFGTMQLERDAYVLNMVRSAEWFHDWAINQLDRSVDRTEVDVRYNLGGDAYYDPVNNQVWLPSPVAVPDVPHDELDDAFFYGRSALGHEIAHAFDDRGRLHDAYGNRSDWWTTQDAAAFEERAQVLVDQYNGFEPLPGLRIDGRRALSESMADLVGLRIALDAFKNTDQYRRNESIAGFTPLQRFFLAYAYGHTAHERPEFLAATIRGAYAPSRERVNGVVMNIPEFHEAFAVQPGDPMYRADDARVRIW